MDLLAQLQNAFGTTYRLERELTGGGMARVFVATEAALGRRVVIKVVSPELAATVSLDRFNREIIVSAGLQHPHIVPVLHAGEVDGLAYFTMPFVDGETLGERLARSGPLPIAAAIRMLRELASALSYAHERGIVHRDIKPANILLSGQMAMVSDFGVAKALRAAAAAPDSRNTTAIGMTFGTPAYMAPEQATADPALDYRADVYSFGVVAYEMLTGRAVFDGPSAQALIVAHVVQVPESVTKRRPDVPSALAEIVMRCLAKLPSARPSSAELVAALDTLAWRAASPGRVHEIPRKWWIAAAAVAVVFAGGMAMARAVPASTRALMTTLLSREPHQLRPTRVVVAPLENRTGDTSLALLGPMAAEFIAQRLAQSGELEVVDPASAYAASQVVDRLPRFFRNKDAALAIAEETGAGTLVSGSYFADRDSFRVQLRVIDVATRQLRQSVAPIAGARSRPNDVIAQLPVRASGALASTIDTMSRWWAQPPSLEAYRAMIAGFERFNAYDTAAAYAAFDRANTIDTLYVTPLFFHFVALMEYDQVARAGSIVARLQAHEARLNPIEELSMRACEAWHGGHYAEAAHLFAQAAHRSGDGELLLRSAISTGAYGNDPRLVMRESAFLDPHRGSLLGNPAYWKARGMALWELGDHSGELANARQALAQFPENAKTHFLEIRALAALGLTEELDGAFERIPDRVPPDYTRDLWIGFARLHAARILRANGHEVAATQMLDRLIATLPVNDTTTQATLLRAYTFYEAGRYDAADAILTRRRILGATNVDLEGLSALVAARKNNDALAYRIGEQLLARGDSAVLLGRQYRWAALLAALRGDKDRAVSLARIAADRGERVAVEMNDLSSREFFDLRMDREFASLRTYGPFRALMTPKG